MSRADRDVLTFIGVDSPVGPLRLGASPVALHILEFADGPREEAATPWHPVLDQVRRELDEYFAGQRRSFEVPLRHQGTAFQERVWIALRKIEYGQTVSYLEQARSVGDEKAVRAVAQANGQNPIAILIPCHRVVNADGSLGGYGGGLLRKQFLLDLERGDRLL